MEQIRIAMCKVSIILPVYNSEPYLNDTLASVVQQTETDFEVLAIDDCSTDKSVQILQQWAQRDNRIRVIPSSINIGVAAVRNRGIQLAKGDYIAFLDSDDIWKPYKLEKQLQLLEQTGKDFCCTAYNMVDNTGRYLKTRYINRTWILFQDLLKENYIILSTVLTCTEVAKQHIMNGTYAHEDYVYWLELLQSGAEGIVLDEVLAEYRLAQSGRSANKLQAAKGRWQIYRQYLGYSVPKTLWYFVQYVVNGVKKYRKGSN